MRKASVPAGRPGVVLAVAVVTLAALVLATPAAARPSPGEISRATRAEQAAGAALESATDRARTAGIAYASATAQLPGAQHAVATAQGKVAASQVKVTEARRTATAAATAERKAQARFTVAQRAVETARDDLGGYVRATYQGRSYLSLEAAAGQGGPAGLLDRLGYVNALVGGQRRALDQVVIKRQRLAVERAVVVERKRQADAAALAARKALAAAAGQQRRAEAAQATVRTLIGSRSRALTIAGQEREASEGQYEEARAESIRIGHALRSAATQQRRRGSWRGERSASAALTSPQGARRSGRQAGLRMPVSGWKSSDYGYRFDPYYHRAQLHAGTDFAAATGTGIRAAASGLVVRAGWNGGYGNYTCIYHYDLSDGRGLSTCYAHQSAILVRSGERVSSGQIIGRVGTTGASTGSHLHFEVRLDGDPVNPLGWL